MVLGSEGRHVPASFFAHLFKEYEYAVQRYQVVQDVVGELRLRIVRKSRFTETAQEGIHRSLAQVLGSAVQVRFELVEAIDDGPEGKPQPCICRVPLPLFSPPEDTEEARREATS
jgi:phenylacetate-CoA ligase